MSAQGSLALSVRAGETITVTTPSGEVTFACSVVKERYADFDLSAPAGCPQDLRGLSLVAGSFFNLIGVTLRCETVRSNRAEIRVIAPRSWPITRTQTA